MAINKVVYGGNTLIDLTGDSVTPETLAEGTTAHAANGEFVTGTGSLGAVRYDTEQVLTDEQKTQARTNIGAANTDDLNTALETAKESGEFKGEKGDPGDSGVYIGENPPEGTKVWINPEGEPSDDYIPTPETAEIGQTVVVKSVDENGKPTEWEAADFPEGGGEVSWDDIKDKPFGEGGFEWKAIAAGSKADSVTDVTSLSVTMGTAFVPALGVTYKVTIADMFGRTKEFTGVGNGPISGYYYIGTSNDDIYARASPMMSRNLAIFFKEPYSAGPNIQVYVSESVEVVTPIPENYLPETVVMEDELLAKGYQTEEQVNALINEALGVIENGTY